MAETAKDKIPAECEAVTTPNNIHAKLLEIQTELKAPKNQYNAFGKYNYRSCEDILEAVKPICKKYGCVLYVRDKLTSCGDKNYIVAVATLVNIDDPIDIIEVEAFAREPETKKGMDDSQITGAASSYARKYALNGLFCIDDTKDADATNNGQDRAGNGSRGDSKKTTKPSSQSPTKPPKEYKCCDCGKPFEDTISPVDGQKYLARDMHYLSTKKNPDGKARCGMCTKKFIAAQKAQEAQKTNKAKEDK